MRSPDQLVDAFRERGLRVTPQRQLLFRLLEGNEEHPTAEQLHAVASAVMPGISLRTVYTTLGDLAEMGELSAISPGGGAMRFDPNVDDHHHTVCDVCGEVGDVYVVGADRLSMDGRADFTTHATSIVFHGTCSGCRS